MKVSVILPQIDILVDPHNDVDVNGANIALWIHLRAYANHPAVDSLELFLAPRSLVNPEALRSFSEHLLEPANRGKGRLKINSVYALPNVWSDGARRIVHTDDVWAMARDRYLRDIHAVGATAQVVDTHCMGHWPIWQSIRDVAHLPAVAFDTIAAVSSATCAALQASFDALGVSPPVAFETCHRRINELGLRPAREGEKEELRRKHNLPPAVPIGLFIGRLTPAGKCELMLLIDTLAESRCQDAHLAIVGVENMPNYATMLAQYAEIRGVASRVHFRGRVSMEERGDWYRASDFFLFPADCINEAFGQTTLEAMACGLPIVASAWDGLKDTLHTDYAFIAPTYPCPVPERLATMSWAMDAPTQFLALAQATVVDREAFQFGFDSLAVDALLRLSMGRAAEEHYRLRFSASDMEDRWMSSRLAQIDAAIGEADAQRVTRQRAAAGSSSTVPYRAQIAAYASQDVKDWTVSANSATREWAAGGRKPPLYAEIRGITDERLFAGIGEQVLRNSNTVSRLAAILADPPHITKLDVHFHISLLAKHGFVTLSGG